MEVWWGVTDGNQVTFVCMSVMPGTVVKAQRRWESVTGVAASPEPPVAYDSRQVLSYGRFEYMLGRHGLVFPWALRCNLSQNCVSFTPDVSSLPYSTYLASATHR